MTAVNVVWFKPNGTYYTDFNYATSFETATEVLESFKSGLSNGYRPGLSSSMNNDFHAVLNIACGIDKTSVPYLVLAEMNNDS